MRQPDGAGAVLRDLSAARDEFISALDDVDPALATTPGLLGEWSAREVVAHLGYWCGHAAEALHLASAGRLEEFRDPEFDVDARNATVARVARETDLATVRQREDAAYRALVALLERIDPELLHDRAPHGATLEEVVRENGDRHYREHTADLRAWWVEGDHDRESDEEDDDAEDSGGDDEHAAGLAPDDGDDMRATPDAGRH